MLDLVVNRLTEEAEKKHGASDGWHTWIEIKKGLFITAEADPEVGVYFHLCTNLDNGYSNGKILIVATAKRKEDIRQTVEKIIHEALKNKKGEKKNETRRLCENATLS